MQTLTQPQKPNGMYSYLVLCSQLYFFEKLEKLVEDSIENKDFSNDILFADAALLFYKLLGERGFAGRFMISIPTAGRWSSGKSNPHHLVRETVFKEYLVIVGEKISEIGELISEYKGA